MTGLSRTDIKNRKRRCRTERVPTPEWAGKGKGKDCVYVRAFAAKDLQEVTELTERHEKGELGNDALMAQWCILSACDSRGVRLFTQADGEWLIEDELTVVVRIAQAAITLNELNEEAATARKKR